MLFIETERRRESIIYFWIIDKYSVRFVKSIARTDAILKKLMISFGKYLFLISFFV